MQSRVLFAALASSLISAACASAPPVAPKAPATTTQNQKMSWILRLEDQRILRAPAPPPSPVVVPVKGQAKKNQPLPIPEVVAPPDLTTLIADTDPRIRRA